MKYWRIKAMGTGKMLVQGPGRWEEKEGRDSKGQMDTPLQSYQK